MGELWFSVLTRALLRRGEFTSRADLADKITGFAIRFWVGADHGAEGLGDPAARAGHLIDPFQRLHRLVPANHRATFRRTAVQSQVEDVMNCCSRW